MTYSTIFILALVASGISVISCRYVPDYSNVPFGTITEIMFSKYVKFTCPVIYGRYPHPESCEYFYECRFGKPTLMHCSRGYLYDRQREQCRDRRTVKCHIGDGKGHDHHRDHKDKDIQVKEDMRYFKCPYTWGTFAHPYDCSKYFVCIYNTPKLFQCNHNFFYDDRYRKCLPQNRVNCGNRLDRDQMRTSRKPIATTVRPVELTTSGVSVTTESRSKFYCPFPYGRYPDPEDCSRYYECRFSVPHLYVCPKSTLYDERKEKCHDEKRVKCGARPGGNDGGHSKFYCPFPYGRYPDPEDCSRYYECRFSVPHLYVCPKSTLYDERKEKCHDEKRVKCGARPGGNDGGHSKFYCPFPYGRYPDPEDCSRYYECRFSVPHLYVCPKSTLYDEMKEKCHDEKRVKCGARPGGNDGDPSSFDKTTFTTLTPSTMKKIPETTKSSETPTVVTATPSTTATPVPTTTTSTTSTTITPFPTTETSTTSTTVTPFPTTATPTTSTTVTPFPTTATPTTTTPVPTTATRPTTTTPVPTTATSPTTKTPIPTTATPSPTTTPASTTTTSPTTFAPTTTTPPTTFTTLSPVTTTHKLSTHLPVTKPNTPPPTDCDKDDLDCIIDGTGDVVKWFDCPRRFGHFPHGSSSQLFIHCDNGRPFVKKCAEETFFSPTYHVCVWADKTKGLQ